MSNPPNDIFDMYLRMLGDTEAPITYHRWSLLSILGTWLGRNCYVPFGSSKIYPNMYLMLMGASGARKSTAIKGAVKLLAEAGYTTIAPSKTSKEQFLLDLAGDETETLEETEIMDTNIFGKLGDTSEVLIAADEFNVFVGNGNLEFLALLGELWDYEGVYKSRYKHSKKVEIINPTINILAGNTAVSFTLAFPPEAIGQGIFSRLILVHGDKTGKKLTIPPKPNAELRAKIISRMEQMKLTIAGEITVRPDAYDILDKIYHSNTGIEDTRFESYSTRRLTHLIKVCMILATADLSTQILPQHVIKANTILAHVEHAMPKALGEFGRARNSDTSNKIMSIMNDAIYSTNPVIKFKSLWKQVCTDLEKPEELKKLLVNLTYADKIMEVEGGFISKAANSAARNAYVDFNLLTQEERSRVIL